MSHELAAIAAERRWWAALVHDTILGALQLAARGGPQETRSAARSLAQEALAALASRQPGAAQTPTNHEERLQALIDQIRDQAARLGLDLDLDLDVIADPPEPAPDSVLDAVARAIGAALTNVARHSGTSQAAVRGLVGPGVDLVVADHGVGFELGAIAPERLGVRSAIVERLAAVGGHAEVHSAPGVGTTIRMVVQVPTELPTDEQLRAAEAARREALLTDEVIPLLQLIAGSEEPNAAQRTAMTIAEAAVRDRLAASPLIDDTVAAALAAARRTGAVATLSTHGSAGDPGEYLAVKQWLLATLPRVTAVSRLTVRWRGSTNAFASLTLTHPAATERTWTGAGPSALGSVQVDVEDDEDVLLVTFRRAAKPAWAELYDHGSPAWAPDDF